MAICAVSWSRISPTMILSDRDAEWTSAARERAPSSSLTGICVMPLDLVLHRIFDGDDLVRRFDLARAA
jgi:hypothetical protein